jgi:two-component system, cell cycle sensor histidine kinase and response regulator CckA
VQIVVSDTGTGMDDATRSRMFEPFYTTKPKGKGTGLGLSTVYGIVKQSGGFISVVSAPGAGTTIELLLPRASAEAAPAPPKHVAAEPAARGDETILLVEDDAAVRELARTTLQRHGYRVLAAADAEDALRIEHSFHEPIALVLSDIVMPGMQGPELATVLRARRPALRVLFMSGYAADRLMVEALKDSSLLKKPFSAAALTRAVREVLDRESASSAPPDAGVAAARV